MNFFSNFFKKSSDSKSRKQEKKDSEFLPKKKAVIEKRCIVKFIENGGKFLYCESIDEVQDNFNLILRENEWTADDVLIINKEIKASFKLKTDLLSFIKYFITP